MCTCRSHVSKSTFKVLFDALKNWVKSLTVSRAKARQFGSWVSLPFLPLFLGLLPAFAICSWCHHGPAAPFLGSSNIWHILDGCAAFWQPLQRQPGEIFFLLLPFATLPIIVQVFCFLMSFFSLHGRQFANNILAVGMCPDDSLQLFGSTWWHP